MPLRHLRPRDITEAALEGLITGQAPEGKTIDYKRELPGPSDRQKKDFLADISSFANAIGGHLVYGMTEKEGLPKEFVGLEENLDQAILRLQDLARDGIRPPIPGLEFVRVDRKNGRGAIVAAIPRSWNPPHQVVFQKDYRFYTRGSAGRQHLDVDELRQVVALSHDIGERIRQFRASRVAAIISGNTPVELEPGARQILHLVPLNAFGLGVSVDLAPLREREQKGMFIDVMNIGGSLRHNVDGLLAFSETADRYDAYAQLFRNGALEIANQVSGWTPDEGVLMLPSTSFEDNVLTQSMQALDVYKVLNVSPPIVVMLSFVGIQGWGMGLPGRVLPHRWQAGFDRDPILIPELILEILDTEDIARTVRPVLDMTWNAAGFEGSQNYDDEGNWKP